MYTQSSKHHKMEELLQSFVDNSKNLSEFVKKLKANKISYEDCPLASGREIWVFTGSSGYDVVGISVKENNRKIVLTNIIH